MTLTKEQCRAARALLDWSRDDLAMGAKVSHRTISDFERGARQPIVATAQAMKTALEVAGVVFVDENGEGPGVRLKKDR